MRFDFYESRVLPGLVEGIWEQRSFEARQWRILPSGRVELIFNLGAAFRLTHARRLHPDASPIRQFCFLSGLHTRPLDVSLDDFHVFGVRLHPVAVRALFGFPCAEVRDGAVDGDLVVHDLGRIEDRLRAAPDFQTRARWLERELFARLRRSGDMAVALRMRTLAAALPVTSRAWSADVSRLLGYSRSHAHRLFAEWLGQPTSELVRLTRFVRALRALHDVRAPLTAVGHSLGYFDQAHFIRNFHDFAGMSPGEYRRRRGEMPGQLEL